MWWRETVNKNKTKQNKTSEFVVLFGTVNKKKHLINYESKMSKVILLFVKKNEEKKC